MHVLVAGAGIIGMSVAEALARRGAAVTVVDRRGPGQGATRASAGMLAPFVEAGDESPLLALGARSLNLFDPLLARLDAQGRTPIPYRRNGTLEVALDDDHLERLKARFRQLDGAAGAAWLDPAELIAFEPTVAPIARGGLFISTHGFVAAEWLLEGLTRSATAAGAVIVSPGQVVAVEPGASTVRVVLADRSVDVDRVVVAAGSWSGDIRLDGWPSLPVQPVRGQILRLQWPDAELPSRIVWGPACYTVPWTGRTLLVGATVEDVGFDERTTVAAAERLSAAAGELLPRARQARVSDARAGLRPNTPDGLPLVGPLATDPRIVAACGHYRNGVLLAPLTAELVSGFLLDGVVDPMLAVTDPNRLLG